MIFETIVDYGRANSKYLTFKPGDRGRYPHLDLRLSYNPEIDCFISTDVKHNADEFLKKDLAIRELMVASARRLFIKDMLGMPCTAQEKLLALNDIANWTAPGYSIETVIPEGFGWKKGVSLNLVKIQSEHIFPIGIMAKGTDIAIIDQHDSTYGQEVAHSLYHFVEGISKGGENITEVHGDPFFVYALQCLDGRLARRVRAGDNPHRIRFPDYVCLRAYAGKRFKEGIYHGVMGLLSPPMNLAASLITDDILVDALFIGGSCDLENAVDSYLGKGSYEEIFLSYDLFGRLPKIISRGGKDAADRMFRKPLFKSNLSQDEIQKIWENPSLRNNDLLDRLEV